VAEPGYTGWGHYEGWLAPPSPLATNLLVPAVKLQIIEQFEGYGPMAQKTIVLITDMAELADDLERIKNGELTTPTVSAVKVKTGDGSTVEDVVIFLGDE
jgi:hypothetical protein